MAEKIIRCPYCILGGQFRPMLRRRGRLVCLPEVWPHSDPREARV
jgi:hypothetical protein